MPPSCHSNMDCDSHDAPDDCIVILYFFATGELIGSTSYDALSRDGYIIQQCAYAVFLSGAGAGIVEEVVFRGVIMKAIEKAYNIKMAILLPRSYSARSI